MTEDIRKLPEQQPRVETGVVQFGEDWPGVFIRGDNALHFAMQLRRAMNHLDTVDDVFMQSAVESLAELLAGCDATRHTQGVAYTGSRGPDGAVVYRVVNGTPHPLPLYLDHVNHSPTGFEWGYGGSGPAQLAYAILYDTTHDRPFAERVHQRFKAEVITPLAGNSFSIPQPYVTQWVAKARAADAAGGGA